MSASQDGKRVDPLVDAYRQASELEAKSGRTGPSAALRAAVLAHARVVGQSIIAAESKPAVSEAVRATPAANESSPIWRIAAGIFLGVAGMWMYQLTRPATTGEANVAVMSAPQSPKASATESAASAPVEPVPSIAAAAPAVTAQAPMKEEIAAAVTTRAKAAPTASDSAARERVIATSSSGSASGARDAVADKALSDTNVALAKVDAPAKRAERSAPMTAQVAAAAAPVAPAAPASPAAIASATPPATTSAVPEVATSEPFSETVVASAEMLKSNRASASAAPRPAVVATPSATAPPSAFPATAPGVMAAAAPPPAAPMPQAASPQLGGSSAMRQGVATTPDATLLSAVRTGDIGALRGALARGANVNARDDTGRTLLQIARERNDSAIVKALELAGAK